MGAISRGVKNTFRNGLRTTGFAVIIAISMALAFSMLLANQAVKERGSQLKKQMGTSVQVRPAVAADFSSQAPPFSPKEIAELSRVSHLKEIVKYTATSAQNPKEVKAQSAGEGASAIYGGDKQLKTSLLSSLEWPTRDKSKPARILPVTIEGTSGNRTVDGKSIALLKGELLDQSKKYEALVGKKLAEKNKLSVGSTFTIGNKKITVRGIIKDEAASRGNIVILPFATVIALQHKKDEVSELTVSADTVENVESMQTAMRALLGEKRADVVSLQPEAAQVVASLKSIENISFITLVIALTAAALTIFLTMLLVIRERKREIGILKAIGASNTKIITQFLAEALMLTLIGALIGMGIAMLASNTILQSLLSSELRNGQGTTSSATIIQQSSTQQPTIETLTAGIGALIDWHLIFYGVSSVIVIAFIATVVPAFVIAKIRPAQIMRSN